MLTKITQEKLDEILYEHDVWLKTSGEMGQKADLSFCDLRGMTFPKKVRLFRASLEGANLEGVNLESANLELANLNATKFNGANLDGAEITLVLLMNWLILEKSI